MHQVFDVASRQQDIDMRVSVRKIKGLLSQGKRQQQRVVLAGRAAAFSGAGWENPSIGASCRPSKPIRNGDMEQTRSSDHAVSRDIQTGEKVSTEASKETEPTESGRRKVGRSNDIRAKVKGKRHAAPCVCTSAWISHVPALVTY